MPEPLTQLLKLRLVTLRQISRMKQRTDQFQVRKPLHDLIMNGAVPVCEKLPERVIDGHQGWDIGTA